MVRILAALGVAGCSFAGPAGEEPPAGSGPDSGTGIGGAICGGAVEASDLISHWRFDRDAPGSDQLGVADALLSGEIIAASGPTRCGDAIAFEPSVNGSGHALINDRPEWDEIRSIDLFVRYPAGIDDAGILSRDASGSNNGNFGLFLADDVGDTVDLIALRVQRSGTSDVVRCAPRPPPDTWIHIGINLGGDDVGDTVEMWIDGALADSTETLGIFNNPTCGDGDAALLIDGSPDPWVLGASIEASSSGTADDLRRPFSGGAIDNLRFARQRREFSSN